MTDQAFDADGLFDDDYLRFFAEPLEERADVETDLIWRLLDLEPGMEVLDLGCGHGRITGRLAERGCRVTGLDVTSAFLERARQDAAARGVPVTYVEGDMRSLPWGRRFDRVISWFTAFGYFDDEDNRRVLTEVSRVLSPGGRFAVELNNRDWIIRNFQPASVIERDGDLMIDQRAVDPVTGRVVTERTVVRQGLVRRIPFFVRMFTFTELRDWLLAAGFRTVTGHGDDGGPLIPDSRRMIVVART
ncbi:SAM-dependent methyltransferase [Actinoallomurus soli]|uniref:SAM-dependent methyltransferase n=1 Tax=Actinoallomurus soli TaxID=2952535 RepID=UPI0020929F25|nr:class I SAM-dependent methyltransferase [Actinoallomurus soli]MCO5974004.1 class I SAM-dependent methyltransferase [Actinoallomurus soli]